MLSKNRNFYKLKFSTIKVKRLVEKDLLLKIAPCSNKGYTFIKLDSLLEPILSNLIFKSQDIANLNDLNFAKIYFFVNRLFSGVLDRERFMFKFKKPVSSMHPQQNRRNLEVRSGNIPYHFVKTVNQAELLNLIIYFIYFLCPFLKQKQVLTKINFKYDKRVLDISVSDLTLLAAGSSAFHLFHDFFDWNKAQLFWHLQFNRDKNIISNGINSKDLMFFYQCLSFFRMGGGKLATTFNF
jgi:hypothetical protein